MVHAELVIDILSEIEGRGALDDDSSIEQLIASDTTLGQQVAHHPELAGELQCGLAALRDLDDYLGAAPRPGPARCPRFPATNWKMSWAWAAWGRSSRRSN